MAEPRLPGLRVRLTLLATAVTALVLVAGAILLVASLRGSLSRAGDDLARARAHALAGVVAAGGAPGTADLEVAEGYTQVVDGSGRVLAASENVAGSGAIATLTPTAGTAAATTVTGPDDQETERYRVWAVDVPEQDAVVYVGTSLESVDEATRTLVRMLAVAVPTLVVLLGVAAWLLVGRTLRPVEQAHRRQREFVADASHELQSPLASLRAQLEVAASLPDAGTAELLPGLLAGLLAETEDMERLVRDLLFLAAADAPDAAPATWVDLDDIVGEEVRRARGSARVELDVRGVSAAPVPGRPEALRRLVRNLVENAVRHATSRVRVTLAVTAGEAVLVVSDDGPGVPAAERERVFDRFHTGASDRARPGHTGLGLAIARAVAGHHGGTLRLTEPDELGGARAECRLPAA